MLKELIHLKYEFFDDNDIQSVQNQVRQILHQLLDYLMSKVHILNNSVTLLYIFI